MDYVKNQKEAIAIVKQMVADGQVAQDIAEKYFPELKESEDEKMIQYFKDLAPFDKAEELYEKYGFSHKDAIAWLEKQGEHKKFRDSIQVGDKVTRNEDGELVNLSQLKRVAKPEQKPADVDYNPFDDFRKSDSEINLSEFDARLNALLKEFESLPKEELVNSLAFYLNVVQNDGTYKSDEKQGEQKPAWSEEDIKTLEGIVCILDGIRYYNTVDSKQEKPYQSEIDWLKTRFKSLRPQSQWKPSEEQLHILESVIADYENQRLSYTKDMLYDLYEQLKKL